MQEQLPAFASRHLGPQGDDLAKMLAEVGAASLDDLVAEVVPADIRSGPLHLPDPLDETGVLDRLAEIARRNQLMTSMIGRGYYGTRVPPVIARNVMENPAWYTAYTPYQAEISQGRLEVLLTFQTMVSDLTGMEIANASLLDEATAAAEAMAMCHRLSSHERSLFLVDEGCHPQTIAVMSTRAEPTGIEIRIGDPRGFQPDEAFGVLLQCPSTTGKVEDLTPLIETAHAAGALVVVTTDLLALTLLVPPGQLGADIVVGSSQRFGVPLGFGGPHAAFLATREAMVRAMPGRLVGVSHDGQGRLAYRLALQTREQHIRRERATSNVCTAQVLLAMMAALYGCWHGPDGLSAIAERVHRLAGRLAAGVQAGGLTLLHDTFFDTVTVSTPHARAVVARAAADGINLLEVGPESVGVSCDETTTEEVIDRVLAAFGVEPVDGVAAGIPDELRRQGHFLTHPVFHSYRTEHAMLRYLRHLADKDLALDRTMIPLGSCTMKLNATTEMIPIGWDEFAHIHPFAPIDQVAGYIELIEELEADLVAITGYAAVSLQPNAGSQGELAGLLAIRAYHRSRGDPQRTVCLIPASAHGTNAASAVMAGMEVVVVACDAGGNVDLADLKVKAGAAGQRLAAVMITYPSTHGVFEPRVRELCDVVHAQGGQVYIDGANLNAMVGLAQPGGFGGDVSHLNLHKTFTIPHGGGGPGIGPIGVASHLVPFLPSDPLAHSADSGGVGPVAASRWGSAGILPIPWTYIRMMGADGLKRASEIAILSANYIASRLNPHFPVLYHGSSGRVAHECLLDIRPITKATGITAEDVAKRLADYGFHAPTLSFPVAGTLMVEPTESEPLAELDRFCEAMIAIREEIRRVEAGEWPPEDNPLKNSPHPAEDLLKDGWSHPYSREVAAYPVARLRLAKYWPPVGRIDGAAGDRNLICACPPMEDYM